MCLLKKPSIEIIHRTICECKDWATNIPKEVVHAFRTVMQETGAHRGYIVSRVGFQKGAMEAASATNIELVTFAEFQNIYFDKSIHQRIEDVEAQIGNFKTYYEPLGPPGYAKLKNAKERAAYDAVFDKFAFAAIMLQPFSPYLRKFHKYPFPPLPFDISEMEKQGLIVPDDVKQATGYRELLELLQIYATRGLNELRAVNPITRNKNQKAIERDD